MENRLGLNKKKIYELPDEVIVEEYRYAKSNRDYKEPKFEPDICITNYGSIGCDVKKRCCQQLWVKSDNKELIDFINTTDWSMKANRYVSPKIQLWKFKKIILEEFYGIKE